jgi:hypothetical protein
MYYDYDIKTILRSLNFMHRRKPEPHRVTGIFPLSSILNKRPESRKIIRSYAARDGGRNAGVIE